MGSTIEPVTKKYSNDGDAELFSFGVSEMQGWRETMVRKECGKILGGCLYNKA